MTPVDFFRLPHNSRIYTLMKLNRPTVLACISLLTLGGLYFGFFRPGSEVADMKQVRHEPKAPPVLTRAAENAGVSTPSFPDKRSPESESPDAGVRAGPSGIPDKPTAAPARPEVRASAADRQTSRPASAPTQPVADRENRPAPAPVGIRLAPDVRLPVAALPNDLNLNPIRQKALQHIIDEYYQTVAAAVPARGGDGGANPVAQGNGGKASDGTADPAQTANKKGAEVPADPAAPAQPDFTRVVEENGEETVMIHNSPEVDAARKLADQRFKALFGKAAYTRMTMNALLESRLPPNED